MYLWIVYTFVSVVKHPQTSSFHCILLPYSKTIVPSQFFIGWKYNYINSVLYQYYYFSL